MSSETPSIVAVLWSGSIGGIETFTASLCKAMRRAGTDVRILFISGTEPLASELTKSQVPFESMGLRRGRDVTSRPRAFARALARLGPDGALLPRPGYLAVSGRLGGYRGLVVAVDHDLVHQVGRTNAQLVRANIDRASGFWASDVEVAVSDFVLSAVRTQLHARRIMRIHNAVDLDSYEASPRVMQGGKVVIGSAGRLVLGKGFDTLIRALAIVRRQVDATVQIAGNGPEMARLRYLADHLCLHGSVEFVGWTVDIARFWQDCDIACVPSNEWTESFGMAALEAMASGKPVVGARNGALPELIEDGENGAIFTRGSVAGLAEALLELASDPKRRESLGVSARDTCATRFDIRNCSARYVDLFVNGGVRR